MKKLFFIVIGVFPIFVFASVGKVLVSKGDVFVERNTKTLTVQSGFSIEKKDIFISKENGKAQLKFDDETVVTIGKNTHFSVNDYLVDSTNPKVDLSVNKGIFKVITGQISKIAPQNFKLHTKSATIGIRGTIFAGEITNESTTVACTQGAISVTANNKVVDVDAGQMTTVSPDGVIAVPKLIENTFLNKISTNDKEKTTQIISKITDSSFVGENLKVDKEAIDQIVEQITTIENSDARNYLETQLNDTLANNFQQTLDGLFYKVTPPLVYQPNFISSDYSSFIWGFYTKDEVSLNSNITFEERLALATPVQTWMKTNTGDSLETIYTPSQTIIDYIGYEDATGNFAPHWDGTSTSRTVGIYSGKVIAVSDYNTIFDTNNLPTDNSLLSAIASSNQNETFLKVDYGNKSFNALIKFEIKNPTENTNDLWYMYVVGSGESHLSPSELKEVAYISANGSEVLSNAEFTFRYLGDNTEQIVGTFNFYNENSSITYGNLVFNNAELIALSPRQIGSNDNFSWGYWASGDLTNKTESEILAMNPNGGWVKPSDGLSVTDSYVITSLIGSGSQLSYTGNIIGTVYSALNNATELMKDGIVSLNFNFGQQTYSGNISFDTTNENWNMQIVNGTISGNSFSSSEFTATSSHTAGVPFYGETNGKFYGTSAQQVAGGFEVMTLNQETKDVKTAIGAFNASGN